MKRTNKIITLVLIVILVLSLASCGKKEQSEPVLPDYSIPQEMTEEQTRFAEFVDATLKDALSDMYIATHIYYSDPAAAGIDVENMEISLGAEYNDAYYEEQRATIAETIEELKTFDRDSLTRLQQDEYDSMMWETEIVQRMTDKKFDYYEQLFTPPNSMETYLVSIISSYQVRNEKDAQDITTLINSLPEFADQSINYAKKQQEMNLLMTDFDTVISNCDEMLETGLDTFIIKALTDQIDELEGIAEDKKTEYKDNLVKAFQDSYLVAIQKIKDGMESMKGGNNITEGIAALPNGKEYFEILLNYKMGLRDMTPEEFNGLLEDKFDEHTLTMISLIKKNPDVIDKYYGNTETTEFTDYVPALEFLKGQIPSHYPEVKDLRYNVDKADPEEKLEEQGTAAYFIIPALDGDHTQQIRVAPSNQEIDSLNTYTTLAHEGFPGHMYQFAYLYENNPSEYLKTLGVDGFIEGYAVYAQYYSLDYLEDVEESMKEFTRLESKTGFLLYSIMDVGINYYGWSREDLKNYMADSGYNVDDEMINSTYDILRSSPANYEVYGYGYELVQDLRIKAEEALGNKFDEISFNKALLGAGGVPFDVIERRIDDYITAAK
ncbi:MAG: DUF885 domain-containing protein [Firmicutes bacterium]|nr:DUF885 domain-containing protein [Bacillota bacterium]